MTARILEAVPNFSEGRDLAVIEAIVDAMRSTGADILDWSADPDHNRTVVTTVGSPEVVAEAAVAGARVAFERIDLRRHQGVHPRVGALDVLPFVPLTGLTIDDARDVAIRVGERISNELGVPVFFYGHASPDSKSLASIRRGGFERLVAGWPADRAPDLLPPGWSHKGAHPTAGVCCIGARNVLLAWNVYVDGITMEQARAVAAQLRESGGGLPGLRALALYLPSRNATQISMNLEDLTATTPADAFAHLERLVVDRGGRVVDTEVIGLLPDAMVLSAAERYYSLQAGTTDRLLSRRLVQHLAANASTAARNE